MRTCECNRLLRFGNILCISKSGLVKSVNFGRRKMQIWVKLFSRKAWKTGYYTKCEPDINRFGNISWECNQNSDFFHIDQETLIKNTMYII